MSKKCAKILVCHTVRSERKLIDKQYWSTINIRSNIPNSHFSIITLCPKTHTEVDSAFTSS